MITFVYCCVCLLIVCCQTTRIENEDNDYTNDSPDSLPKVAPLSYKAGSDIIMKCDRYNKDIIWEFKHCQSNYIDIYCDERSKWKKLNDITRRLEIKNATENHSGVYRCSFKDTVKIIYSIHVIGPAIYLGPPPKVLSMIPSPNTTVPLNTPFSVRCYVSSIVRPEIRWFKQCNGQKCDVSNDGYCYCGLSISNPGFSATSRNVYLSKLILPNTRLTDSGMYFCLVMSLYGKDHKNITLRVEDLQNGEETNKSLLFLIPLCFILVPVTIWLCFYRRKKKNRRLNEHQKKLIKPVVQFDIVLEVDDASSSQRNQL